MWWPNTQWFSFSHDMSASAFPPRRAPSNVIFNLTNDSCWPVSVSAVPSLAFLQPALPCDVHLAFAGRGQRGGGHRGLAAPA